MCNIHCSETTAGGEQIKITQSDPCKNDDLGSHSVVRENLTEEVVSQGLSTLPRKLSLQIRKWRLREVKPWSGLDIPPNLGKMRWEEQFLEKELGSQTAKATERW